MVLKDAFIIRESGFEKSFYVDYRGVYSTDALEEVVGIDSQELNRIYEACNGVYNAERQVYYFHSREDAADAIDAVWLKVRPSLKGKALYLTEKEVEYIRRALINEDSNIISMNKAIKDGIFNKLNEQQ